MPTCGSSIDARPRAQVHLPVPLEEVRELFAARPVRWLRPFLSLAAHRGTGQATAAGAPTGFRLGRPVEDDGGGVNVDLTWWPHLRDGLFESFRGRFELRPDDDGTVLRLAGPTHGGAPERNAAVLDALVELLADALTADQVPVG